MFDVSSIRILPGGDRFVRYTKSAPLSKLGTDRAG